MFQKHCGHQEGGGKDRFKGKTGMKRKEGTEKDWFETEGEKNRDRGIKKKEKREKRTPRGKKAHLTVGFVLLTEGRRKRTSRLADRETRGGQERPKGINAGRHHSKR